MKMPGLAAGTAESGISVEMHAMPSPSQLIHRPRLAHLAQLVLALAVVLALPPAHAQSASPARTVAKPAAQPAPKAAPKRVVKTTPRQQLKDQAGGLALASQVVAQITQAQLDLASHVYTGTADCEFKQTVSVQPLQDRPGHFTVAHLTRRYTMVPQETSTGAVRLEDSQAGVMWLQIPAKSMLMDSRRGQRLVDSCQHDLQRQQQALSAQAPASGGLGISEPVNDVLVKQ
jgi:hypothetical protein